LGYRLLGNAKIADRDELEVIVSRRYEYLKACDRFPDHEYLKAVYVYCAPCACQIQTAINLCRGKGVSEFLRFFIRIDERILSSCRRMAQGIELLSSLQDRLEEYPQEYIDCPWLEQRIEYLDREEYAPRNANPTSLLAEILSQKLETLLEVEAIIIIGEAQFCAPMLDSPPFPIEPRKTKERDYFEISYSIVSITPLKISWKKNVSALTPGVWPRAGWGKRGRGCRSHLHRHLHIHSRP
jgi:hypothetical protein